MPEPHTLTEQQLKSELKAAWKKHEKVAREEMGPLLYWLRDKLRAQGSRNDIHDKDRGFGAWVEDNLDISRRTADRWADDYAVKAGLKAASTSGQVSKSDEELYEEILANHQGKQQIAFNTWVPTSVHVQFQKALTTLQSKFGVKNKKEALVRGVIYAATTIDRSSGKVVGRVSLRKHSRTAKSHSQLRARKRTITRG